MKNNETSTEDNMERLNDAIGYYAQEVDELFRRKDLSVTQKFVLLKGIGASIHQEQLFLYEG